MTPHPKHAKIRTHLAQSRIDSGITQSQLARLSNVRQSMISMYESGGYFLSYDRAGELAVHLNVTTDELYARHNTDTIEMYLENMSDGQGISERTAFFLMKRLKAVMMDPRCMPRRPTQDYIEKVYSRLVKRMFHEMIENPLPESPLTTVSHHTHVYRMK